MQRAKKMCVILVRKLGIQVVDLFALVLFEPLGACWCVGYPCALFVLVAAESFRSSVGIPNKSFSMGKVVLTGSGINQHDQEQSNDEHLNPSI